MKHLDTRMILNVMTVLCLGFLTAYTQTTDSIISNAHFSLDSCDASIVSGTNMDYSEFSGDIDNSGHCVDLEIVGGSLYRENPEVNYHSCTQGVDGSTAMCVGSETSCTYNPGSERSIKIDVLVTPGELGLGLLSSLSFYERAPLIFSWIDGSYDPNAWPRFFAVRILVNGEEVFLSEDNDTEREWNHNTFDFSDNPAFVVSEPTVFNIELLAYCPVDNGAAASIWDVDEITITSDCCELEAGGELSGGPFEFCVGDERPDHVSGVTLSDNFGTHSQYVVTDTANTILAMPPAPDSVNFDGAGPGICLIWHVSYENGLTGLEMGNNLMTDLDGCFSISNAVTVQRNEAPAGGELSGGPFAFCVGDGEADHVSGVTLAGNTGANSQYVVTDEAYTILALPPSPDSVNFDGAGPGICLIWHLSYDEALTGLEMGNNLMNDVDGCFGLSNAVTVERFQPMGGELSGGPFSFCVGDGEADYVSGVTLTGNSGTNSQYVVTDTANTILALPPSPDSVNFDDAGAGVCLIWHVSYADGLTGLEMGSNLMTGLDGCFDISNAVTVIRSDPQEGGELSGGPFEFCVGDGEADHVSDVTLTGDSGVNSQYVVTDTANTILALPPAPDSVNFDGAGPGICLIWHVSYGDGITGLEMGNNLMNDLVGCFDISNAITVQRNQPEGGELSGGPFEFCVGDTIADYVSDVTLSGNTGDSSQYVVTDTNYTILSLPPAPDSVNFDGAGGGICLIWHLSYVDTIAGLELDSNLMTDLVGCFDLSNAITVVREEAPCDSANIAVEFGMYPNPVRDVINLEFIEGIDDAEVTVQVFNAYGQRCLSETCYPGSERRIDVSTLSEGHYFVQVSTSKGQKTHSLVILR